MQILPDTLRYIVIVLVALALSLPASGLMAEPFEIDPMPADFDGVVTPWHTTNAPVAVDFNGDGKPSWYAGGNQIAHQQPHGFLNPLRYASTALPNIGIGGLCPSCKAQGNGFAVGDVNRDGRPDIVRMVGWDGHSFYYTLQVYLARADGGFDLGWRLDDDDIANSVFGQHRFQMILADFDRDGDNDLAILALYETTDMTGSPWVDGGSLYIRWNNNAQFGNKTTLAAGNYDELGALAAGDFDRDGDIDLLADRLVDWTANGGNGSVDGRRYENDGTGNFSASAVSDFWFPMAFVDLNRDGWKDFVGSWGGGSGGIAVGWRSNDGAGQFWGKGPLAQSDTQWIMKAALIADFNEDSRPDLLTIEDDENGQGHQLVMRRGNGNGVANVPETIATFVQNIVGFGHGDARSDADEDVLLRFEDGTYQFLRNTAQRLRPAASGAALASDLSSVTRLEVADANRDGAPDIFALQPGAKHLNRALASGHAGAYLTPEFKIVATGTSDFTIGDYNRDGRTDLAWVVPSTGAVRWARQTDDAYFFWPEANVGNYPGAEHVLTGNGALMDGRPDILVSSGTTGGLSWFRNQNNAASWTPSEVVATQDPIPDTLALVPFYYGYADAAFGCGDSGGLFEMNGYSNVLGWGLAASVGELADNPLVRVCAAADIDTGGGLELVFQDGEGRLVWWTPTNSPPIAKHIIDAAPPIGPINAIEPTDWNRDGLVDLLVASSGGLYLYSREDATGTWNRRSLFATAVQDVVAVDAYQDSRPDALIATAGVVALITNTSSIAQLRDAVTGPDPVQVTNGETAVAASLEIVNPGVFDEDASIAVSGMRVVFRKAVLDGVGGWTRGPAMTKAEVQQAVTSVSIRMGGLLIGTAGTAATAADGTLQINYSGLGNAVPIPPEESRYVDIHVKLRADATSASYSQLYVDTADSGPIRINVLHDELPVGKQEMLAPQVPLGSRLQIVNPQSLPDVFADGFE